MIQALLLILHTNKVCTNSFQFCYKCNEMECIECENGYSLLNGNCISPYINELKDQKDRKIDQSLKAANNHSKSLKSNKYIFNNSSKNSKSQTIKESDSGNCGENVQYSYIDGTLTIQGSGKMTSYKTITPPWFKYASSIKTVQILNGVTSIGYHSFIFCDQLISVSIPNSVESIEIGAFRGCKLLNSITIPDGVTSIDYWAFEECEGLTSFNLPSSVTLFSGMSLIKCINIKTISVDPNNEKYKLVDGVVFSKKGSILVYYPPCKQGHTYQIPDNVDIIDDAAFSNCKELVSITIPNGVTSILSSAFNSCIKLESIYIPYSVSILESSCFFGCKQLSLVTIIRTIEYFNYNAFSNCENLISFNYYGSKNPTCDDNPFQNSDLLTSVNVLPTYKDDNFCNLPVNKILIPLMSPTQSPSRSLSSTRSPTRSPSKSPSKSPTRSPSRSPTYIFTHSNLFTRSNKFSLSFIFSFSDKFTQSNLFTKSNQFSLSQIFSFSDKFTQSYFFSSSYQFSLSSIFSLSNKFTQSQFFSLSDKFNQTKIFSFSDEFTQSQFFSLSHKFSQSEIFSSSNEFTQSFTFSKSNEFTDSHSFSASNKMYNFDLVKISFSLSLTYITKRSVSFSATNSLIISYTLSYDANNQTYTLVAINVNTQYFSPYIIYFYSPTYIQIVIESSIVHKKQLSNEQLIGISCGSATAFFLIIYIIYSVYQCKYSRKIGTSESFLSTDDSDQDQVETVINENIRVTLNDPEMDNWL